jgi:hypothetical protein
MKVNTFLADWAVAMIVYLCWAVINKSLKIDVSLTHSLLIAVSMVAIYRLSKIYDLLKQRQCCKDG